jgi:peptide/nickel transport system permease protein
MTIATETYVEAARSIGCSPARILRKHIFPNAVQPLLVQVTFAAGLAATAEAVLSFLGLGVTPPTPSWGSMIQDAYRSIYQRPTLLIAPAVLLTGTVLALSTFADGLDARFSRKASNRG